MIAGVDGTSRGWVVVLCNDDLEYLEARFIQYLTGLPHGLRVAAVDVPMGLPERGDREADRLARRVLGEPRRRSVFTCPIRSVVLHAGSWEEACAYTQRADGRQVSRQKFGILRKVREADELVRSEPWALRVLREVHPELSFAKWAGRPMEYNKKCRAGREERQSLIGRVFGPNAFESAREEIRRNRVAPDDLADAFAAVWTASRIAHRNAERFPETQMVDSEGILMHIWA